MTALVIGAGPAGLMAAEELAKAGRQVVVTEAKPSVARKLLMAGKSGLNLTKREDADRFMSAYGPHADTLRPMIEAFGPQQVEDWATALGQTLFAGTTGRVFPDVMKASPLLRAWLGRLAEQGVEIRTRWRFMGWDNGAARFETGNGDQAITPSVTILAMGGGSWRRLGSDGLWAQLPELAPVSSAFQPSNVGLVVPWTDHMAPHFGKPLKAVKWSAGPSETSRGEAIISARGLEGGGLYPLIPVLRDASPLFVDLAPDQTEEALVARLSKAGKTLKKMLRNTLRWPPEKIALFHEFRSGEMTADPSSVARTIKRLEIKHSGPRPIDEAISTAGGLRCDALTDRLEIKSMPGVFACGEMLDWDAPTGGYLLTACLSTGRWAGRHAAAVN